MHVRRLILMLCALVLVAGCGSGNVIGPAEPEKAVGNGDAPHLIPPTKLAHWWDGEPDDVDLGP